MKVYFWKKYRIKEHGSSLSVLNKKTPGWKPFLLILPSLLTVTLFTIIPFIVTIVYSFTYQYGQKVYETRLGFENYKHILTHKLFHIGVRNSIVYSMAALPISLFISLLISTAIVQVIKKWARGFWQTVFFLPYVTSGIAVSLAFHYIFKSDGGILNNIIGKRIPWVDSGESDTWLAFVAILARGVWGNLAFQILILTSAMLSVDPLLYKAAAIDGSNKTQQFFTITLPSIRKTISFLITMGLIGGIKTFPLALFNNSVGDAMNNGGVTIMMYVYAMVNASKFYLSGAASVILFLIGVVVSFSLRKLVSLSFIMATKIGERNVIRKFESKALKTKTSFAI